MRLLEKDAARRYDNAQAVLEELKAIERERQSAGIRDALRAESGLVGTPSNAGRLRRTPRLMLAAITVAFLAVAWATAGWLLRVTTPKGTLVIESAVGAVEVRITRGGSIIIDRTKDRRLELAVGEYGVELVNQIEGVRLSADSITIERGGSAPIRIWRESPADMPSPPVVSPPASSQRPSPSQPAVPSSIVPPEPAAPKTVVGNPTITTALTFGNGTAKVEGEMLHLTAADGGFQVLFGDPNWSDLDFHVECRQEEGNGNIFLYYRCQDAKNRRQITLGSFDNRYLGADLWQEDQWSGLAGIEWSLALGQWQTVRMQVRGDSVEVFINNQSLLTAGTPVFPRGKVGLAIAKGRSQFRNIKVTSPTDDLLWVGFPKEFISAPQVSHNPSPTP